PKLLGWGLVLAMAASLAPALLLLVPLTGAALFLGSALVGRGQEGARLLVASLLLAAVAFVALAPWSFATLHSWAALLGPPSPPGQQLGVAGALRLESGPYGGGPLGYALVVAAAVCLFIGRSWRLAWAGRFWAVALVLWAAAWAGSRGWFSLPALELMLAPVGAALVFAVALGAVSVETDLSGYRFGWRQFAPPFGALAMVAAALPLAAWAGGGRWDVPPAGAEAAYAFPSAPAGGDYRVLWLGPPGSLPLAAQGSAEGLSFGTSLDGLPTADELWPAPAAPARTVARDVTWAGTGETTALGHLLAPLSVRYVIVPLGRGRPVGAGAAVTGGVVQALGRQVDLVPVGIDPSYSVFANRDWLPVFSVLRGGGGAQLAAAGSEHSPWAGAYRLQQLQVRPLRALRLGTSGRASLAGASHLPGEVLYGSVPDGSWVASAGTRRLATRGTGPGASRWRLPPRVGTVAVARAGTAGRHGVDLAVVLVWAAALWASWRRSRRQSDARSTVARLRLPSPATEAAGADWPSLLDETNLG
ncbi:MAG: hypothetical protein ACRDZX_04545, partial [Acidimicrobiales bacterium]